MALTTNQRRQKSNPVLIGVLAGFVSPLSSIIWGIRQRSWSLALVPYSIVVFFLVASLGENNHQKVNQGIKYSYQISSGIIAYEIAKTLKMKAKKKSEINQPFSNWEEGKGERV
tara:strand:- start:228 stop:569 length:342 start_codon:yes stop_codon:yes gene_type:complete